MLDWVHDHAVWLGIASLVMFVATALAVPVFVARMPADHFLHDVPPFARWRSRHPVLRWSLLGLKNLLGALLVLVGLAMLVLPGQGLISIVVGLGLLDFAGKHRVQVAILRRQPIARVVNWMRARAGQPPLLLPPS